MSSFVFRALSLSALAILAVSEVFAKPVSTNPPDTNTSSVTSVIGREGYHCEFTRGGWNADDWKMVKRPLWDHLGGWVQGEDHIANEVPVGATDEEMLNSKAPDTYTGMVLKQPLAGNLEITCEMSFDHRMAPSVIVASQIGESKDGRPEHRDHLEICLFDRGINIWRHEYIDGKDTWVKLAWGTFKLQPKKKYALKVSISGPRVEVTVDGHTLGCTDLSLPKNHYVGLVGDEGLNRFYSFDVKVK